MHMHMHMHRRGVVWRMAGTLVTRAARAPSVVLAVSTPSVLPALPSATSTEPNSTSPKASDALANEEGTCTCALAGALSDLRVWWLPSRAKARG